MLFDRFEEVVVLLSLTWEDTGRNIRAAFMSMSDKSIDALPNEAVSTP
jgi:hypothetical protein